jgi:hypothetical protein
MTALLNVHVKAQKGSSMLTQPAIVSLAATLAILGV